MMVVGYGVEGRERLRFLELLYGKVGVETMFHGEKQAFYLHISCLRYLRPPSGTNGRQLQMQVWAENIFEKHQYRNGIKSIKLMSTSRKKQEREKKDLALSPAKSYT